MLYLIFILWDWCCGFMDVDCYRDRLGRRDVDEGRNI